MSFRPSKRVDKAAKTLQNVGIEAVTGARPIDFTFDPTSVFEDFQMLRNRALRERQNFDNFAADARAVTFQKTHDGDSRRMPERRCQLRQSGVFVGDGRAFLGWRATK